MTRKRKRQSGFSLVEVLFAVFLTATCAALIASTVPIANSSRARANYLTLATNLAQKQMEAVRGIGYANLTGDQLFTYGLSDSRVATSTDTWAWTNVDGGQNDSPARVLPTGAGTVKIEQVDVDLRRVTVEVTYRDQGKTKRVTLGTLIANL